MRAPFLGVNWSVVCAWSTAMPRINESTWLHLRGVMRTNRWIAFASISGRLPGCRRRGGLLGHVLAVASEHAGGNELAQLVPHHVLGDVNGQELVAVVHGQRVADELGQDRAASGPCLEHPLLAAAVQRLDLADQAAHDVRPLLDRTCHRPSLSLYFFRRRTMSLSLSLAFRVLSPLLICPHGEHGCLPPEDLPSPPPIGWSTGFIATPRTLGRRPSQRLRPAFPNETFSWSRFPTWPTTARQFTWKLRTSPDGSRSCA